MPLNRDKAVEAVRTRIAEPLGVSVDEAAALIRRVVEQGMASAIKREVHLRGYHPEDFALFAFGGGGPTHVAGYRADVPTAVIFPQAPVFSALGSSVMDILHVYEQSRRLPYMAPMTEQIVLDRDQYNEIVDGLVAKAKIDLDAEGLGAENAVFSVELDMLYGGQVQVKRVSAPVVRIEDAADAQLVYDAFEKEFSEAFSPHVVNKPGGVYLDGIVVKATVVTEKMTLPVFPLQAEDPGAARTTSRPAYWPELGSGSTPTSTPSTRWPRATACRAPRSSRWTSPPSSSHPVSSCASTSTGSASSKTTARPLRPGHGDPRHGRSTGMSHPTLAEKLAALKVSAPSEYERSCADSVRSGDYEIGVQRTADVLDEGYEIFMRSSRSSMGVAGDSIVAIFNAAGDLVNASAGTYLHAVIPPIVIKYILARHSDNPGINDGDIWYTNDALYGGIHNPDQVAIMPVFFRGELVAWTAALSHTTETGAIEPGGMPLSATSRFQEGMNLPPMRVGQDFTLNTDVIEMFAAFGLRAEANVVVDMRARATTADRVRVRLLEMFEREGKDFVVGLFRRMLDEAEAGARKRIAQWADGTYRCVTFSDAAGLSESLLRNCAMTMTKKGEHLLFDFSGTSPRRRRATTPTRRPSSGTWPTTSTSTSSTTCRSARPPSSRSTSSSR
jgi:hypothetical protein